MECGLRDSAHEYSPCPQPAPLQSQDYLLAKLDATEFGCRHHGNLHLRDTRGGLEQHPDVLVATPNVRVSSYCCPGHSRLRRVREGLEQHSDVPIATRSVRVSSCCCPGYSQPRRVREVTESI